MGSVRRITRWRLAALAGVVVASGTCLAIGAWALQPLGVERPNDGSDQIEPQRDLAEAPTSESLPAFVRIADAMPAGLSLQRAPAEPAVETPPARVVAPPAAPAVPPPRVSLLAITVIDGARVAWLLRGADGAIEPVVRGDVVDGHRVDRIDASFVEFERDGRRHVVRFPESEDGRERAGG